MVNDPPFRLLTASSNRQDEQIMDETDDTLPNFAKEKT